ncbi:hypothetical protein P154DRAFT_530596 [Amniculicola lignicola CBS 123094]|uniref:Uncharacterized protein n=1 Tax=Amniculicola lignicola CBS 123094 TaxID=1392246 RepID=A0A6A5WUV1_9PLEO|nr:hypothetical protein P154DRAFT_530596 [Amniculicola lignicola CBS 123094]
MDSSWNQSAPIPRNPNMDGVQKTKVVSGIYWKEYSTAPSILGYSQLLKDEAMSFIRQQTPILLLNYKTRARHTLKHILFVIENALFFDRRWRQKHGFEPKTLQIAYRTFTAPVSNFLNNHRYNRNLSAAQIAGIEAFVRQTVLQLRRVDGMMLRLFLCEELGMEMEAHQDPWRGRLFRQWCIAPTKHDIVRIEMVYPPATEQSRIAALKKAYGFTIPSGDAPDQNEIGEYDSWTWEAATVEEMQALGKGE